MNRTAVNSSNIKSAGYDPASQTLEIEFKSGTVYQYHEVPSEVHSALLTAPSVGKFFFASIKDKYKTTKLDKPMHTTGD